MTIYITFGQSHLHNINNKILDKDTIAVIEAKSHKEGRDKAFELFGERFFTTYTKKEWLDKWTQYYPKGFVKIE